jgi:hypothetical protein
VEKGCRLVYELLIDGSLQDRENIFGKRRFVGRAIGFQIPVPFERLPVVNRQIGGNIKGGRRRLYRDIIQRVVERDHVADGGRKVGRGDQHPRTDCGN